MKIALFGGTFDPVHWGHLLLAEAARDAFHLDRVLFIPTGTPPHKKPAIASSKHRLQMLRLALRSNPGFVISDWEVRQNRVVYSYETIAHFKQEAPRAKLYFIVGTDMLRILDKWVRGRTLLKECTFLAAERPETPWTRLPAWIRRNAKQIVWPEVPLASHEIRDGVRDGRSIRYQVPEPVLSYIQKHRLYR
jgi:nicotinate-nucleotide adenylyltransferase